MGVHARGKSCHLCKTCVWQFAARLDACFVGLDLWALVGWLLCKIKLAWQKPWQANYSCFVSIPKKGQKKMRTLLLVVGPAMTATGFLIFHADTGVTSAGYGGDKRLRRVAKTLARA